jgi:plastocyanin
MNPERRRETKITNRVVYIGVTIVVAIASIIGTNYWINLQKSSTTPPPPPTQFITIVAKETKFNVTNPQITVTTGSVGITIINQDTVPHNFLIKEIPSVSTNILNPGQSQTITVNFTSTGTYHYYCSIHPGLMDGTIQVIAKS